MQTAFFRRLVIRALLLCVITLAALGTTFALKQPSIAHAATATFTESNQTVLYNDSNLVSDGIADFSDGEMGVWQNGSTYHFLGSDGSGMNETHTTLVSGTLDQPIQTINAHLAIQNIPSTFNYVTGGPVYQDPGTGDLLAFLHLERWANPCCYSPFWASLGLAISKDGGATWTWCGEIIQHNDPFSTSLKEDEEISSGGFVIVNGYFYVYFNDTDTSQNSGVAVARAPVTGVVNAAINDQTTSWSKYYQGNWNQPGLGGNFTNILGSPYNHEGEVNVTYNTYLNQYVLALNYYTGSNYYLDLRSSDNPLDFSASIENDIAYRAGGLSQYPTFVGLGTNPQYTTGQIFYVYYMTWGSDGVWGSQTTFSRSTITANLSNASFPVPGANYTLTNQGVGKCMDNNGSTTGGTAIIIWSCVSGDQHQQWTLNNVGNGYYQVINQTGGECLDDWNGSSADGNPINQFTCVPGDQNQAWKPTSLGNGYYELVNQATGKCVDNWNGSSTDGNQLRQFTCVGNQNQAWQPTQV